MTYAEARAQFPVLERIAYLQAGSTGPLARQTIAAMHAEDERNLMEGRSGQDSFDRVLALRAKLRDELASLVAVEATQVALTASTTDGCNLVLAGLELGPGDEIITTTDEHFGLLGPLHSSGARVVVTASMSGWLAALANRPDWGFTRGTEMAERCHQMLADAGEDVVSPTERATIVSWRPQGVVPADVVARLASAGVLVRDIPKTGLVRASVGWWTSEEDLDRLVSGLRG